MHRTRSSPRKLASILITVGLLATACGTTATPSPAATSAATAAPHRRGREREPRAS